MTDTPGWILRHTYRAHTGHIGRLAWSPDGARLGTPGDDGMLIVWNTADGKPLRVIRHPGSVACATFSPDGNRIAAGFDDPVMLTGATGYEGIGEPDEPLPPEVDELLGDYAVSTEWEPDPEVPEGVRLTLQVSDCETGSLEASFYDERAHAYPEDIAWSPDGRWLLTASTDGVAAWQVRTGQLVHLLAEGGPSVSLALSPDGDRVASAGFGDWTIWDYAAGEEVTWGGEDPYTVVAWSARNQLALGTRDGTVEIASPDGSAPERYLEGHTSAVTSVSFSADGSALASKALDGTVRLWSTDSWEVLSVLHEPARGQSHLATVAFAPKSFQIATLGPAGRVARVWDLDPGTLAARRDVAATTHYANAKVVLVGDSGVGKTGLGLVLSGEPFRATESSHGRNVWLMDVEESGGQRPERRETYLWDLAGQPGYRVVHQLHLSEVAAAIVVFDARSETDPFAGVRHWVRALRQGARESERSLPKVLVAARIDRGGPPVSQERINELLEEHGFEQYIETSARRGQGISELFERVRGLIEWASIPKVSSTGLFDSIKSFVINERNEDRLLVTVEDLLNAYVRTQEEGTTAGALREEFVTCVGRVAARGLIRRLSFGGLVLLRPEMLDAYAAAVVLAARDQPDATGSIGEDAVRNGDFAISDDERLDDSDLERLLLAATIEEVLRHEIALREHSDEGTYLVFPTQARTEAPPLEEPNRVWLTIAFEGPVQHIYATLVVRLAHSGLFSRESTYRNAATFQAKTSVMGVAVTEPQEGSGRLELFNQGPPDPTAQGWFADYVVAHVRRRGIRGSVEVDAAVRCPDCGIPVTREVLQGARDRDREQIVCPVCDGTIAVPESDEESINDLVVRKMDTSADEERNRLAAAASVSGKEQVGEFDVFLAHHSEDQAQVRRLAENLRSEGLNPWLDKEQIPPGRWVQDRLQAAIREIPSAAIVIGREGLGPWQVVELRAFIEECVNRDIPVIPVLLPGTELPSELPFLKQLGWVRFEESVDETEPLGELRWGITGDRPVPSSKAMATSGAQNKD